MTTSDSQYKSARVPLARRSLAARAAAVKCAELRGHLGHAQRFARTLDSLLQRTAEDDPAFVWLAGRGDEVRAFAGDVARSWMIGERTEAQACAAIESYLDALHESLHPWFGEWYAPSCCGPYAPTAVPPSGARLVVRPIHRAAR
jgi:hypothetical protein